jgi:hypothetical protein
MHHHSFESAEAISGGNKKNGRAFSSIFSTEALV